MISVIPIKFIKLEGGFHLLVPLRINGKPARVLIDTGASQSVFDKERIKKFLGHENFESHDKLSSGLGTSEMKSHLAVIEKISLGNIDIKNYKSVIIDLSHVNVAYAQKTMEPIDGVLGSDILKKYKAVIDYARKRLQVRN